MKQIATKAFFPNFSNIGHAKQHSETTHGEGTLFLDA